MLFITKKKLLKNMEIIIQRIENKYFKYYISKIYIYIKFITFFLHINAFLVLTYSYMFKKNNRIFFKGYFKFIS